MATIRKGNSLNNTAERYQTKNRWMMWTMFRRKPAHGRIPTSSTQLGQYKKALLSTASSAKSPWVCRAPHTHGLFAAPDLQKHPYFRQLPRNYPLSEPQKMQDSTTPEANPHTISQLPHQLTARSAELAKPTPHRPTLKTSSPLFDFAEYVKLFQ